MFIAVGSPGQSNMDLFLRKVYELYTDYVLKNPFYSLDMPIRYVLSLSTGPWSLLFLFGYHEHFHVYVIACVCVCEKESEKDKRGASASEREGVFLFLCASESE